MLSPRYKKLIGALLVVPFLSLYTLSVASFSAYLEVAQWSWILQLLFFVGAGIAWIFPAKPALQWMQRP